uniref:Uncharacterized protein n=1 Tax=viral metagenome TaxID=1070528 RepID=A0A6M3K1V8_9ZZZZ
MKKEQIRQFFAKKGEPNVVQTEGKKFSLSSLPKEQRSEILKRLAEKDKVMARGLLGEIPGLLIDGKQVTKDNIHEFELKPKEEIKVIEVPEEIKVIEKTEDTLEVPEETFKELYTKSDLEKLSFKELKVIGKKFGTTDRSKSKLIKEILKLQ